MSSYVRDRDDLEQVGVDEQETIDKIIDLMATGQRGVAKKHGETVRISHAKGHAFAKGELVVFPELPPRGMAVKVLGVDGPKLPGHEGASTRMLSSDLDFAPYGQRPDGRRARDARGH